MAAAKGVGEYVAHQDPARDDLVEQHAPLIKRVAYHLIARLPPNVQLDDLLQAGVIGLLDAASRYNPSQGASFETYASIRIRGAMIDEIRRMDWTPRSVHKNARTVSEAIERIERQHGRAASAPEIAAEIGISIDEYHRWVADISASRVFSSDELTVVPKSTDFAAEPHDEVEQEGFKQALAQAIKTLPKREQLLMALYYDEELNLKEIGEVLGVSESRVCQIHGQLLTRLRAKLRDWTGNPA